MNPITSFLHFAQRSNIINARGTNLEHAVDQKLGYKEISPKTLAKLHAIFNAKLESLENSGTHRAGNLMGFKSTLDRIENAVVDRSPSKARSDLLVITGHFQACLNVARLEAVRANRRTESATPPSGRAAHFSGPVSTQDRSNLRLIRQNVDTYDFDARPKGGRPVSGADVPSSPRQTGPTALQRHAEVRIGYVRPHESTRIDPKTMTLFQAFERKASNRDISSKTRRALDEVFEGRTGITLDPWNDVPELKDYDFANIRQTRCLNLEQSWDELERIRDLLTEMPPCAARQVLLNKVSVYEVHVATAEQFWMDAFSKSEYTGDAFENFCDQTSFDDWADANFRQWAVSDAMVREKDLKVQAWLGWSDKELAREIRARSRAATESTA